MANTATRHNRAANVMEKGDTVEVLCTLTDRWVSGFEVVAAGPIGYRVRRQYDGTVIPDVVPLQRVRAA